MARTLVRAAFFVGVAHAMTLGPAMGSNADFERCAGLEDDAARLECYDALVRGAIDPSAPEPEEPTTPTPSPLPGDESEAGELAELVRAMGGKVVEGWLYQESSDPIDGSAILVGMRPSNVGEGAKAQILIGCVAVRRPLQEAREDPVGGEHRFVTRVALGWGVYLGQDTYSEVRYVVDNEPPRAVSLYTDQQSIVASGETALGLVRELLSSGRLAVWVTPYEDTQAIGAVFDLSGIDAALQPLQRRCAW